MRADWDARARENALHYVNTAATQWTADEFYATGEQTIREQVLNDMQNICLGRDPRRMRVLEIGCGAGRLTRALAAIFGEVHAVDISPEMIRVAGAALADRANVRLHVNNGCDLDVLPSDLRFDFASSAIVFQHIPSREVIESYVRAVGERLRPGSLFKFQVQGYAGLDSGTEDTWVGAGLSEDDAVEMGRRCGFDPRYRIGAGTQDFWLWFFKRSQGFAATV